MSFDSLLQKLKIDHLQLALDNVCEHAAKQEVDYQAFLTQTLSEEWSGRHQKGFESRLKQARLLWVKTMEEFSSPVSTASWYAS